MEQWEKDEQIKGTVREIEILKARRKKLNQQGWKINYNTQRGQLQSEKLEKDLEFIDDNIIGLYEDLSKLRRTPISRKQEVADYSLKVKRSTALKLKELGSSGDTIDDVITKLIAFYEDTKN